MFRIRVFLDPDFKSPDPDPSVFCFYKLMGSKWCSLIRFWRNLTKEDSFESANYDIILFLLVITSFWSFFSWIWIRIFGRSGFGLRKKSPIRIRTKGPGSKTLVEIQQFNLLFNFERKLYGTKTMTSEESSALRRWIYYCVDPEPYSDFGIRIQIHKSAQ